MSKKLLITSFLFVAYLAFLPQDAFAHVLVSDDTKKIGAVLHIVPDDNPVAGQQASLYFDIQTRHINAQSVRLTITDATTNETSQVPVSVENTSVTANYIFPVQGVYKLRLVIAADKNYVFNYSQRVSRGITNSALDSLSYPLASMGLVFGVVLLLLLLVVVFNNRKGIKEHSTF